MPESVYIEAQDRYVLIRPYPDVTMAEKQRLENLHSAYRDEPASGKRTPLETIAAIAIIGDYDMQRIQNVGLPDLRNLAERVLMVHTLEKT